jgi:hypothetical protein
LISRRMLATALRLAAWDILLLLVVVRLLLLTQQGAGVGGRSCCDCLSATSLLAPRLIR